VHRLLVGPSYEKRIEKRTLRGQAGVDTDPRRERIVLSGEIPNPITPPPGCTSRPCP